MTEPVNSDAIGETGASEYVCEANEIDAGELRKFVGRDGAAFAIGRVGDEYYAIDDGCTHGQASLSEGYLSDDYVVECPFHGGAFDIRTGATTAFPCVSPVKAHQVSIEEGKLFLKRRPE